MVDMEPDEISGEASPTQDTPADIIADMVLGFTAEVDGTFTLTVPEAYTFAGALLATLFGEGFAVVTLL